MPHDFVRKVHKGTSDPFAHEVMSAVTGFVHLPLANGVPFVSPFESPSVVCFTWAQAPLSYTRRSVVKLELFVTA